MIMDIGRKSARFDVEVYEKSWFGCKQYVDLSSFPKKLLKKE